MAENQVKITYHIYLEAEDVSQSRILSSTSYVKNLFKNCGNHYFQGVEEECSVEADAKDFPADMAEFLDNIAQAHSFLDMEGDFTVEYQGEKVSFKFASEAGADYCDFEEIEEA